MKLNLKSSEFSQIIESEIFGNKATCLIQSVSFDTRKIVAVEANVFFALEGEFRSGLQFIEEAYSLGIRIFVVSNQVECENYPEAQFHLVNNVLESLQVLAKVHRTKFSFPIVAITGSAGKTTVKEWLYHLISDHYKVFRSPKSYNSQLGVALSLLELDESYSIALIEAGISQKNEMDKLEEMIQATYGIFTSFGSAHAHNFSSKTEHLSEKLKLFKNSKINICFEDFSHNSTENFEKILLTSLKSFLLEAPFQDKASLSNLSLCVAFAQKLSIPDKEIVERIQTLPRLALRMETFEGINGNTIINDSYNADLDALTLSLEYQKSIAKEKLRTAVIGIDGLSDHQIQKIKQKINAFQLYQCFYVTKNQQVPVEQIHQQIVLIKGSRSSNVQQIANLFQLKKHKTRIEIDLNAVKKNVAYFRSKLKPKCKLLVMVKASSYGSGSEKMAEILEKYGVDYLGVAYTDEGIELRKHGCKLPILVMNAEEDSFEEIINNQLEPALYSFETLELFTKKLIDNNLSNYPIHLKFDTGMNRLGFDKGQLSKVIDYILAQPELKIQSVYSHLSDADNQENRDFTNRQISHFNEIYKAIEQRISYPFTKHLLNSEGILRYPEAQFDMVRIGIGIFGITQNQLEQQNLHKVISWESVVSQVKNLNPGDSVGYNRSFIAEKPYQIAIIPVGYADGFKRNLSQGKGGVYIRDIYCPVLGKVCMDMIMVDVSNIKCVVGDSVEIIGEKQNIEDLAEKMQTIPYEVLTSFSKRLHRVYLEE